MGRRFTYSDPAYVAGAEVLVAERAEFFASMRAAKTTDEIDVIHRGVGRRYHDALAALRKEEDRIQAEARESERHERVAAGGRR